MPGDVISVTEKGGGEGRDDKNERSQRVHAWETNTERERRRKGRKRERERWDGAEKLGI